MIACCSVSASGRPCDCNKVPYRVVEDGSLIGTVFAYNEIEAKMSLARAQGLKNAHGWTDYPSTWIAEREGENV